MNAKELFETTMNPENRKLLRIDMTNVVEAEEMFTKLMGDEVEPRRQFIEDNALNVRNLDVVVPMPEENDPNKPGGPGDRTAPWWRAPLRGQRKSREDQRR